MPNIREYLKSKRKNKKPDYSYKKSLFVHKAAIFYRFIVIIVAIVAIGIGIYVYFENKVYTEYNIVSNVERTDSVSTKYLKYNEYIFKYSNDGASCTDYENNILWNQTFEMQNPMVDICGEYIAVADKEGNKIYIFNKSGLEGEIDVTLPISQIQVASQGVVYAVVEEGNNSYIYVYSKAGEVIAKSKQPMAKSGYPLDITVSDNGEKLGVSYLYVDSGIMKSDVAFYNFGSVGQNESDNLVSGYTSENIIYPVIEYVDDSTAIAVGDNKIEIYRGKQRPELYKEISIEEEIRSVYCSDKYIALIFDNTDGTQKYRLDLYTVEAEKILSLKFDKDYKNVILRDEGFIITGESEFSVYNISGMEKFNYKSGRSIINVIQTDSNNRFVVIDSANTQVISLKFN